MLAGEQNGIIANYKAEHIGEKGERVANTSGSPQDATSPAG